ncbi:MAG: chromate transporter [Oscillospiraceae bacterium]|nr:chromate transporter [Oscillospiraceae bacterium]
MRKLLELFFAFAKVSVGSFGGGYAMLPLLQREIAEKKRWTTEEELADYYALSQCTPGAIAVNTATYVGKKQKGVPGGISATLGVVFPSVLIITATAALLKNLSAIPVVQDAFAGVRACVCVLILNTVIKLFKSSVKDKSAFVIFLLVLSGAIFIPVSPVCYIPAAALAGIAIKSVKARRK